MANNYMDGADCWEIIKSFGFDILCCYQIRGRENEWTFIIRMLESFGIVIFNGNKSIQQSQNDLIERITWFNSMKDITKYLSKDALYMIHYNTDIKKLKEQQIRYNYVASLNIK